MKKFVPIHILFLATLFLASCAFEQSLHRAAYWGDLNAVKDELSKGADVNNVDDNGWTPLYSAVSEGHKEIVMFLLSKGARIDVSDNNNWTIIDEATFKEQTEIIDILQTEQTRRQSRYSASIRHFGSLVVSDRTTRVYSEWIKKYPLPIRSYWDDPFRSINDYVRTTEVKYLSSQDFHGTRYGFEPEDVTVVQGKFESDRSYQIRTEQIIFEQEERRKKIQQVRRLMIADSIQWILGTFKLENPYYDRIRGVVEFDLVSKSSKFRQRIGSQLDDAKLVQSVYKNPDKVLLDVIFRIADQTYQLYGVKIFHQGNVLNATPIDNAVYNLSS